MEIKDVKIGDTVQIRKDIPTEELAESLSKAGLGSREWQELQRRGEVTVRGIQYRDLENDWDSITIEEMGYYWPIELFEPVNKPKVIVKSKEEQVQEDIQTIKDIIKRYGLSEQEGYAAGLVQLLTEYGIVYKEFLTRTEVESV